MLISCASSLIVVLVSGLSDALPPDQELDTGIDFDSLRTSTSDDFVTAALTEWCHDRNRFAISFDNASELDRWDALVSESIARLSPSNVDIKPDFGEFLEFDLEYLVKTYLRNGPDERLDILETLALVMVGEAAIRERPARVTIDLPHLEWTVPQLAMATAYARTDFEQKANACKERGDASCRLVVTTVDVDGSEREGYEVLYIKKFWEIVGKDGKWRPFDEIRPTTSKTLQAGNYILKCRSLRSGEEGNKRECELREAEQRFDVNIPQ